MWHKLSVQHIIDVAIRLPYGIYRVLSLAANGTDNAGRIIGAVGPYPTLRTPGDAIGAFRRQVMLVDLIGSTDIDRIVQLVA